MLSSATRSTTPAVALLPLRAFLGLTFAYAGLSKILDPHYLDDTSPYGVQAQMLHAAVSSPIGPLVTLSAHHPAHAGLAIAFGELAVGLGTLLGLFTRLAALGGVLLALSFYLTVSWTTRPYYLGADIAFAFAWTPLLLAGDAGLFSLTHHLRATARRKLGRDATSTPPQEPGARDDVERRTAVLGGLIAAAVAALGIPAGSALALARRRRDTPSERSSTAGAGRVIAAVASIDVGTSTRFTAPNGSPAFLLHPTPDTFVALDATCSHQGCPVAYVGPGFRCPCHGATYDQNGHVTGGPALAPLTGIPLKIVDGEIAIG